jgi:hypothetical protein
MLIHDPDSLPARPKEGGGEDHLVLAAPVQQGKQQATSAEAEEIALLRLMSPVIRLFYHKASGIPTWRYLQYQAGQ